MAYALISANYGAYDEPVEVRRGTIEPYTPYYFTEPSSPTPPGWKRATIDPPAWWHDLPTVAQAKVIKINPWLFLTDPWRTCIWIDANITIKRLPDRRCRTDFVCLRQRNTDSFYRECELAIAHKRPYMDSVRQRLECLVEAIHSEGFPDQDKMGGLCTRFIMRKNTPAARALCDRWLEVFLDQAVWRDQIALRYAAQTIDFDFELRPRKECGISYDCVHRRPELATT